MQNDLQARTGACAPMKLAEQARRRVELAAELQREPIRWIVSNTALATLRGEAAADAWSDGTTFLGLPFEVGRPRFEWGLELVCAP